MTRPEPEPGTDADEREGDTRREIEAWAAECAVATALRLQPPPLLPGRKLTADEVAFAHEVLRAKLEAVGVTIEAPEAR